MTVLVSGGAGFIGSHIVEALVKTGVRVRVLDNVSTGNLENLKSVQGDIELIVGDIRDPKLCRQATDGVTKIFHTAALVSVPGSIENPALCHEINVIGMQTLLAAAQKNHVPPQIIFSSSSAVYGIRDTPCTENDSLSATSPYAESKIIGEKLCQAYSAATHQRCVSLRYFNVYGPRQNPQGAYAGVVAKFRLNLLNREPLKIFGDGSQTRDFIHVTEVAAANLAVATHTTKLYDVFNIGTGSSITLLQLIQLLETETHTHHTGITFFPSRPGDILHSRANCSKYRKLLAHYQPESAIR